MIPAEHRERMGALRAEFARRVVERGPSEWARLHLETRTILLMLAGIDPSGEHELPALADRDWREFTPSEQTAIRNAGAALRWQLNSAAALLLRG